MAMADPALDAVAEDLRAGRVQQAAQKLNPFLKDNPDSADGWLLAARAAQAARRGGEALRHYAKATALAPAQLPYRFEFAMALFRAGQFEACAKLLSEHAGETPLTAPAATLLGVALSRRARWDEAIAAFDSALAAAPDDAEAASNKGGALFAMGKPKEAIEFLLAAHQRNPKSFSLIRTLGHTLFRLGKPTEAAAFLDRIAQKSGNARRFYGELATYFHNAGETDPAILCGQKAVEAAPEDATAVANLGVLLRRAGRINEAFACFRKSLDLDPNNANGWNNLANLYADTGQQPKAEAAYKKAVELDPEFTLAQSNVCRVLLEIGKPDEAAEYARKVLSTPRLEATMVPFPYSVIQNVADFQIKRAMAPRIWPLMAALPADRLEGALLGLMPLGHDAEGRDNLFRQQCRWGDHVKAEANRHPLPAIRAPRRPKKGDKVRVGFLSSDLRSHNVTKFLMPIFRFYDKDRMELNCYSSWQGQPDRVQQEIEKLTDRFVHLRNMNHRQVAEAIRADDVDVLIEFNGITRYSQARALAYRAAPVQVCWLGYPFTLGLADCDFHLLDPHVAPTTRDHMREAPLLLPQSWICFDAEDAHGVGFGEIPVERDPPVVRDGIVRFGTMNKPYKYSEGTIDAWVKVLQAVPDSRMVLVRPEARGAVFKRNMTAVFAEKGIPEGRLEFLTNPPGQHMGHYNAIDICLDTLPQVGGTTTTESLWMGVPVVTLAGPEMYERLSHSILTNTGLGDLSATEVDGYVRIAAELAADTRRLADLRRGLRDTIKASPLCDATTFVPAFTDAMRTAMQGPAKEQSRAP